jgi:dTDP-4-dehydrorhamnose reductase
MRIAVTGARGLVGGRLCLELWGRGHEVVALVRRPEPSSPPPVAQSRRRPFQYRLCELTDGRAVEGVLGEVRPEVIIHTASMADVDLCQRHPDLAYANNVDATAHLCRAARSIGAHLVHVSTDYVFDGERGPYGEEDLPNPRGAYATTKHMAEQAVQVLSPTWAIARTAVVYGWPPSARPNFGSWLVSTLREEKPARLFEDQLVSPSLALSVAAMLAEIGERKLAGTWNVCGADVVDRLSFGRELCRVFGLNPALCIPGKVDDAKLDSPRPRRCGLRANKAAAQLRAKPLSLSAALAGFHAEYLESGGSMPTEER